MAAMERSVWFLLDRHGHRASKVEGNFRDVDDFCKAVKANMANALSHCDASQLHVFLSADEYKAKKAALGDKTSEPEGLRAGRTFPLSNGAGTEEDKALYVVAPVKEAAVPSVGVVPDILKEMKEMFVPLQGMADHLMYGPFLDCYNSSKRSDQETATFKAALSQHYNHVQPSGAIKCMVLHDVDNPNRNVIAAHILPHRNAHLLTHFGLQPAEINSPKNGLFLTFGIEKAFDNLQVTFVYKPKNGVYRLKVLDPKLMSQHVLLGPQKLWTSKWCDIDGRELILPPDKSPYRRLMALHTMLACCTAVTRNWQDRKIFRWVPAQPYSDCPLSPEKLGNVLPALGYIPQPKKRKREREEAEEEEEEEAAAKLLEEAKLLEQQKEEAKLLKQQKEANQNKKRKENKKNKKKKKKDKNNKQQNVEATPTKKLTKQEQRKQSAANRLNVDADADADNT